jgi:hypothetical protein
MRGKGERDRRKKGERRKNGESGREGRGREG